MKSKLILVSIALIALLTGIAVGAVIVQYFYPMVAQVGTNQLTAFLDGTQLIDGDTIDWSTLGPLEPDGTYIFASFEVVNEGSFNCKITLTTQNMPEGWALTWTANETIVAPLDSVDAPLELYVAADASEPLYEWGSYVSGEIA